MHTLESQRPWGKFQQFTLNEPSTVKIIAVEPNQELSLQYHHNRSEFWYIIDGNGRITIGDQIYEAQPSDEFTITPEQTHRISAGGDGIRVLEIAFGEFNEEDIVRLSDRYGRE